MSEIPDVHYDVWCPEEENLLTPTPSINEVLRDADEWLQDRDDQGEKVYMVEIRPIKKRVVKIKTKWIDLEPDDDWEWYYE